MRNNKHVYINGKYLHKFLFNPSAYISIGLIGLMANMVPSEALCNSPKEIKAKNTSAEHNLSETQKDMIDISNQSEELFDDMENKTGIKSLWRFNDHIFAKAINYSNSSVEYNEKQYVYRFEIPGYDKEEIKIEVAGKYLMVSAIQLKSNSENKNDVSIKEKSKTFNYRTTLPADIKVDTARSNLKNGILTIIFERMPIKEEEIKVIPIS